MRTAFYTLVFLLLAATGWWGAQKWIRPRLASHTVATVANTAAQPSRTQLVEIIALDATFVVELRYTTAENFTKKQLYPEDAPALLAYGTAKKLVAANAEFRKHGYRLKIWDAYRPLSVQRAMWRVRPDARFVADPRKGSMHNRGAAVDVTLVDRDGVELEMPTGHDDFTKRARSNYTGASRVATANRHVLAAVMKRHGFRQSTSEWWHFSDTQAGRYPLRDISFVAWMADHNK